MQALAGFWIAVLLCGQPADGVLLLEQALRKPAATGMMVIGVGPGSQAEANGWSRLLKWECSAWPSSWARVMTPSWLPVKFSNT